MRIAVPSKDSKIDDHFGHCAYYTLYTIEDNKVTLKKTLESPQGCGCKSNIASVLKEIGVTLMIAGSMGEGAKNVLNKCDIEVIRGCSGSTDDIVEAYLNGKISDSGIGCESHEDGHECNH